jgi:polyisoprenoid-binding protein YceI
MAGSRQNPTVEFAAKHMMITAVKGRLADLRGTTTVDESRPQRSSVELELGASFRR